MLRYMISPITGSGTVQDPYRSTVEDVSGVNTSSVIPSNPDGTPKYHFALCLVATPTISIIAAVTNAFVFPDYPLDAQMSGMDSATRTAMVQSVQAYDLDGNGLHFDATNQNTDSYRTLITSLGQQLEQTFSINGLTCPEVAG